MTAPPIPPDTSANTGPVAVTHRSPNGDILWKVSAKSSRITYGGENELSGSLEIVNGEIYENGKLASSFSCSAAEADQKANKLELKGGVIVIERREGAKLSAQTVKWDGNLKRIEASGNVRVVAKSYQMGPFDVLYASPDLMNVGTPDVFKSEAIIQGRDVKP